MAGGPLGTCICMQTLLPLLTLERVLLLNVSHENDLIFMRMNVQVTYIFIPIVSHIDSFCHRGKSKLGIGLFIHELLREPLIHFLMAMFRLQLSFPEGTEISDRVSYSPGNSVFYHSGVFLLFMGVKQ